MGSQQSSAVPIEAVEKPGDAQDLRNQDAPSLKAHAIECSSVASSFQSLSDLEGFLKPGELALTRWSRPNAVPSEILNNPIYEGEELHSVAEEERDRKQPVASVVVEPTAVRTAADTHEPTETAQEDASYPGQGDAAYSPDRVPALSASVYTAATVVAVSHPSNDASTITNPVATSSSSVLATITSVVAADVCVIEQQMGPTEAPAFEGVTGTNILEPMVEAASLVDGVGKVEIRATKGDPPPPSLPTVATMTAVTVQEVKAAKLVEIVPSEPADATPTAAALSQPGYEDMKDDAQPVVIAGALNALPTNVTPSKVAEEPATAVPSPAGLGFPEIVAEAALDVEATVNETPAADVAVEDVVTAPIKPSETEELGSAPVVATGDAAGDIDASTAVGAVLASVTAATENACSDMQLAGPVLLETLGAVKTQPFPASQPTETTAAGPSALTATPADIVTAAPALDTKARLPAVESAVAKHVASAVATADSVAVDLAAASRAIAPTAKTANINTAVQEAVAVLPNVAKVTLEGLSGSVGADEGGPEVAVAPVKEGESEVAVAPVKEGESEAKEAVAALLATAMSRAVAAAESVEASDRTLAPTPQRKTSDGAKTSVSTPPAGSPPVAPPATPALQAADRLKSHCVVDTDLSEEEDDSISPGKTPPRASRAGTGDTVQYPPGSIGMGDARSAARSGNGLLVDGAGDVDISVAKKVDEATASGANAAAASEVPSSPVGTSGDTLPPTDFKNMSGVSDLLEKDKANQRAANKDDGGTSKRGGLLSCFACFSGQ